ncbi:hypothetical protein JW868_00075 [Candidatus Woesearchaeota archaeon]|nr:hypothetical protein [Candidatus Woesearchaeota archaeon]
MNLKKCENCSNDVPHGGQCSECGYVHGLNRPPTDEEYKYAREINEKNNYPQYKNIDMLLLD